MNSIPWNGTIEMTTKLRKNNLRKQIISAWNLLTFLVFFLFLIFSSVLFFFVAFCAFSSWKNFEWWQFFTFHSKSSHLYQMDIGNFTIEWYTEIRKVCFSHSLICWRGSCKIWCKTKAKLRNRKCQWVKRSNFESLIMKSVQCKYSMWRCIHGRDFSL